MQKPILAHQHSTCTTHDAGTNPSILPPQCVAFVVTGAAESALAAALQKPGAAFNLSEQQVRGQGAPSLRWIQKDYTIPLPPERLLARTGAVGRLAACLLACRAACLPAFRAACLPGRPDGYAGRQAGMDYAKHLALPLIGARKCSDD